MRRKVFIAAFFALLTGMMIGYTARLLSEPRAAFAPPMPAISSAAPATAAERPAPTTRESSNDLAAAAQALPHVAVDLVPPRSDDEFINTLRAAFGDANAHRSQKAVLDLLEYMTPQNARRVRDIFVEFDKRGIGLEFAWRAFWTRWGEIDGPGAIDFAVSQPDLVRGGHWHYESLMSGWAAVDPAAAGRWLRTGASRSGRARIKVKVIARALRESSAPMMVWLSRATVTRMRSALDSIRKAIYSTRSR